ncbi:hypothetical protein [Saccharopolyspora shandongensis]
MSQVDAVRVNGSLRRDLPVTVSMGGADWIHIQAATQRELA